jgi:aspartyl-tRNA(Asn)/glutamyl-tRNA(Gln) amidotransferase subunit C
VIPRNPQRIETSLYRDIRSGIFPVKFSPWASGNKSPAFELDDCESSASALFVTTITMSSKNFDVEYVAELARIKLTPDEIKTFESQLGLVLEHVTKLNEVDVSQVEPMAHSFPIYNVFREDQVRESLDREAALANAPHQAHGLFIVTKVVE